MAMTTLEKLTKQREQLNAKIQAVKTKKARQDRKDDTRRKVLIGSVVMKMVREGEMPQERLTQLLDKHLEKEADRTLFKLSEQVKSKKIEGG